MAQKIKLKRIARTDEALAREGRWHDVSDENGQFYGSFKLRFWDVRNKAFMVELERWERKWVSEDKGDRQFKGIAAFVQVVLLDWKNVLDENDKQAAFDRELAMDLLCENDGKNWLVDELFTRASDARNYAPALAAQAEEVAGN